MNSKISRTCACDTTYFDISLYANFFHLEFNDSGWNIAFAAFNTIIGDSWKFLFKELYFYSSFVLPIA